MENREFVALQSQWHVIALSSLVFASNPIFTGISLPHPRNPIKPQHSGPDNRCLQYCPMCSSLPHNPTQSCYCALILTIVHHFGTGTQTLQLSQDQQSTSWKFHPIPDIHIMPIFIFNYKNNVIRHKQFRGKKTRKEIRYNQSYYQTFERYLTLYCLRGMFIKTHKQNNAMWSDQIKLSFRGEN